MKTQYVNYKGVSVTIAKNGTAFADYPNCKKIIYKLRWRLPSSSRLLSDQKRYRVNYPQNSVGRLFLDIDAVMK